MSRAHVRDSSKHVILGTQQFKPAEFATQIKLNMDNAWGILRCIIDICMRQKDGKYLIMKDPNKVLKTYSTNFVFKWPLHKIRWNCFCLQSIKFVYFYKQFTNFKFLSRKQVKYRCVNIMLLCYCFSAPNQIVWHSWQHFWFWKWRWWRRWSFVAVNFRQKIVWNYELKIFVSLSVGFLIFKNEIRFSKKKNPSNFVCECIKYILYICL